MAGGTAGFLRKRRLLMLGKSHSQGKGHVMRRNLFSLLVGLVLWGSLALAQVTTGTISGAVKDSTGGVVPGAEVVVLNEDTGISRTVQTDAEGRYSAPSLNL